MKFLNRIETNRASYIQITQRSKLPTKGNKLLETNEVDGK